MNFEWFLKPEVLPALWAGTVSMLIAVMLVLSKNWHGHLSMDSTFGVQKFHTNPTPRIGGIAIAVGLILASFFAMEAIQYLLWPLIVAGIPAFAFGLLEDLTKRVSVRTRLLATMSCAVLGWFITGYTITEVNVPGLDWILSFSVVSILFTAFAVGGVANAINIIDGFNGLAAGASVIILCGFAALSWSAGDRDLAYTCLMLAGAVMGFLLVNWPWGKLFLGDGGAYFVGFALAWIAVLLLARHPEISAWAPLLVCAYPILEVGFSVYRRRKRGCNPGAPDRLHLHSLVKKRFVRKMLPNSSNLVRNSVAGLVMWGAALIPAVLATTESQDSLELAFLFVLCALLYSSVYARLTQFRWCVQAATMKNALESTA
jgi:UDP-N-acetylmuramyl pentapeptide phosphotransferase/UDP-N-acetylglucosamine-1-phosphate transferase